MAALLFALLFQLGAARSSRARPTGWLANSELSELALDSRRACQADPMLKAIARAQHTQPNLPCLHYRPSKRPLISPLTCRLYYRFAFGLWSPRLQICPKGPFIAALSLRLSLLNRQACCLMPFELYGILSSRLPVTVCNQFH